MSNNDWGVAAICTLRVCFKGTNRHKKKAKKTATIFYMTINAPLVRSELAQLLCTWTYLTQTVGRVLIYSGENCNSVCTHTLGPNPANESWHIHLSLRGNVSSVATAARLKTTSARPVMVWQPDRPGKRHRKRLLLAELISAHWRGTPHQANSCTGFTVARLRRRTRPRAPTRCERTVPFGSCEKQRKHVWYWVRQQLAECTTGSGVELQT